jgi:hypothetical protein
MEVSGAVMAATGGWLVVTRRTAPSLVSAPWPLLTIQRKTAPLSEAWAFCRV